MSVRKFNLKNKYFEETIKIKKPKKIYYNYNPFLNGYFFFSFSEIKIIKVFAENV